jgi:hypothetical protein
MRKLKCVLVAVLLSAAAFSQALLTNEVIVRMVKAGVSDDVIVTMVGDKVGQYSLAPNDLIGLKQSGVSDKVIGAMVSRNAASPSRVAPAVTTTMAPPANPVAPAGSLVLHDSTPIRLRLTRNLSSADAKSGDTLDFEVLDDVKADDTLVIARGSTAIGTVTEAQAKRRMARGGKLDITIDYVRLVNGEKAALRGVKETSGGGHTGAMTGAIVATSLVVWPAAPFFLFMHGKDTTIPKGTEITAYINGEIKLNSSATTQAAEPVVLAKLNPSASNFEAAKKVDPVPGGRGITVRFTSAPGSAEVDVDGSYWGTTPTSDLTRLPAGAHTIVVKKIGYKTWERKLDLAAGDDRTVNAELEVDNAKARISGLN